MSNECIPGTFDTGMVSASRLEVGLLRSLLLIRDGVIISGRAYDLEPGGRRWSVLPFQVQFTSGLGTDLGVEAETEPETVPEVELAAEVYPQGDPDDMGDLVPAVLSARLRPGRFVKEYSHKIRRLSHLEHDGFSFGHLTLDEAHA